MQVHLIYARRREGDGRTTYKAAVYCDGVLASYDDCLSPDNVRGLCLTLGHEVADTAHVVDLNCLDGNLDSDGRGDWRPPRDLEEAQLLLRETAEKKQQARIKELWRELDALLGGGNKRVE